MILLAILAILGAVALCMTVSPIKKGVNTIRWGSNSTLGTPSAAVVRSARITPKNGSPIEIEDGDGFAYSFVILDDGFDADVEINYDTALTWPAVGDTVALTLMKLGAVGGTQAFNCTWLPPGQNIERKAEGTIAAKLIYRPNAPVT